MWGYCRGTADADIPVLLMMTTAQAAGSERVRVEYIERCWCCCHSALEGSAAPVGHWVYFGIVSQL